MTDPFVTIDLHGLMREDAMKRIDRVLRDAGPYGNTAQYSGTSGGAFSDIRHLQLS